MFKFVVFFALLCLVTCAPTPGIFHGIHALPAATSYSSRVDLIHSTPIIKTYAAPAIVATPVIAKTVSYAAPVVASYGGHGYGLGAGLEHDYGSYGLGHSYGSIGYGHGSIGYGHGW